MLKTFFKSIFIVTFFILLPACTAKSIFSNRDETPYSKAHSYCIAQAHTSPLYNIHNHTIESVNEQDINNPNPYEKYRHTPIELREAYAECMREKWSYEN